MNKPIALALIVAIIILTTIFNTLTGQLTKPPAESDGAGCPECNLTCPPPSCPELTCPSCPEIDCDNCCPECPECDSCCEQCPGCNSCCLPEANEENCQQYCEPRGSEPMQPNITYIKYTGATPVDEWVQIEGSGTDMANWTLSDLANHTYAFPNFVIDGIVRVHTGTGTDNETDLFWGSGRAIWNNDGDTATLKDQEGNIISVYEYD